MLLCVSKDTHKLVDGLPWRQFAKDQKWCKGLTINSYQTELVPKQQALAEKIFPLSELLLSHMYRAYDAKMGTSTLKSAVLKSFLFWGMYFLATELGGFDDITEHRGKRAYPGATYIVACNKHSESK